MSSLKVLLDLFVFFYLAQLKQLPIQLCVVRSQHVPEGTKLLAQFARLSWPEGVELVLYLSLIIALASLLGEAVDEIAAHADILVVSADINIGPDDLDPVRFSSLRPADAEAHDDTIEELKGESSMECRPVQCQGHHVTAHQLHQPRRTLSARPCS